MKLQMRLLAGCSTDGQGLIERLELADMNQDTTGIPVAGAGQGHRRTDGWRETLPGWLATPRVQV